MHRVSRRDVFRKGGLIAAGVASGSPVGEAAAAPKGPEVYTRIGVWPFINCTATYTINGGSMMLPEVVAAIEQASHYAVNLDELMEKVGDRLAELLQVEWGMVTAGCAAALTHATAACIAGTDPEKIQRLPDVTGMKSEVIIQKTHRNAFDHAIRNVGVKLVVLETAEEMENAISEKTAMMYFLNGAQNQGKVGLAQFIEIGKRHGVPTFNDAAADVPPKEHLNEYVKMGFDLVTFSGGKGLRGPQCAGLMIGRKDLIDAALLNNNPHEDTLGRPCKVGKEEICGMFAALERYWTIDHVAEWQDWEARLASVEKVVATVPGVHMGRHVPEVANHVPHLYFQWDEKAFGLTQAECGKLLEDGDPSIICLEGESSQSLSITPFMMKPGEERIVARRLKEIFASALKKAQG